MLSKERMCEVIKSSCRNVTRIEFRAKTNDSIPEHYDDLSEGQDMPITGYICGGCYIVSSEDTIIFPKNCTHMFDGFKGEEIMFGDIDTSNVTNMSYMFYDCKNLESLDLSGFYTLNVTDMESMFAGCENLESLDLSGFYTLNVTDMSFMFSRCSSLQSLDLSGFDTSNVTNMIGMFGRCTNLKTLDLSVFNTSNVTNMVCMFYGCENLKSLNLSIGTEDGFDTWGMFSGCINLKNRPM